MQGNPQSTCQSTRVSAELAEVSCPVIVGKGHPGMVILVRVPKNDDDVRQAQHQPVLVRLRAVVSGGVFNPETVQSFLSQTRPMQNIRISATGV